MRPPAASKGGARRRFKRLAVDRDRRIIFTCPRSRDETQRLVVDIGGTTSNCLMSAKDKLKFDSGPDMTPRDFVRKISSNHDGAKIATVSIGFPSVVRNGKIVKEPKNLGTGWVGFNFSRALKKADSGH